MRCFFIIITVIFCNQAFGQKPMVDTSSYSNWSTLGGAAVSDNGKYMMYTVNNVPVGSKTLIVREVEGKWKKEFKGGLENVRFDISGKSLVFDKGRDSLTFLTLGTNFKKDILNEFLLQIKEDGKIRWIVQHSNDQSKNLLVKDLKTNRETIYKNVSDWRFMSNTNSLITIISGPGKQTLHWIDFNDKIDLNIWEGKEIENLVLDDKHQQFAFSSGDSILIFHSGNFQKPILFEEKDLNLGSITSFSKDGKLLFIQIEEKTKTQAQKNGVEIWSYLDISLQSEKENINQIKYSAVLNTESGKIVRLQQKSTEQLQFPEAADAQDTLALVTTVERWNESWSKAYKITYSLISTKTGHIRQLDFLKNNYTVSLSPNGIYLIFYASDNYYSYEIETGITRNLTENIEVNWMDFNRDDLPNPSTRGIGGWIKNDAEVLVYDRFDIWRLDMSNKREPLCITNGLGKKGGVIFSLFTPSGAQAGIHQSNKLYLSAFNILTKDNGFYVKKLDDSRNPELLTMGPFIYLTNSPYVPNGSDFIPIRAKNAESFLVRRMSASEAPNYYSTRDFKVFKKLSNVEPQKKYNWYTTELHAWRSFNGDKLQGILYKPENFDPNKEYPVIFNYYERKSDGLNAYINPEPLCDMCSINVPTYVSQGYLVFTPDIYFSPGKPMQGTYDAVVSAANYLAKLPYVNSKKMGIQGCSFGAIQTNFLITQTNLFAAAVSSSGNSDLVSSYGSLVGDDILRSKQNYYESGQGRMFGSLWEKPQNYIQNSPIFYIDKIVTPLLIMHTKNDSACLLSNAIELFTGLRRLGKKVWMTIYPEGNHGLWGKEARDFNVRMMQFFDHYLKNKPAPTWMTRAAVSGQAPPGFEYDKEISTPGSGLLTIKEQIKVDSISRRKPITLTFR